MAPRPTELTGELFDYVLAHIGSDDVQDALIAETRALGDPAGLQISPDEGAFLTMITRLTGVRKALEIGTFTGFSALCIAPGRNGHPVVRVNRSYVEPSEARSSAMMPL